MFWLMVSLKWANITNYHRYLRLKSNNELQEICFLWKCKQQQHQMFYIVSVFSSCILVGHPGVFTALFHSICSWYWLFYYLLHFCLAIHVVLLPFYTWLCKVFWCLLSTYNVLFFVFWSRPQKPISPSFHMSYQILETFHRWRLHAESHRYIKLGIF